MRIAIIGCGLIGKKRAEALMEIGNHQLVFAHDIDKSLCESFCKTYGCKYSTDWSSDLSEVDVVLVATFHDVAVNIVERCLRENKHVLCEKPLGTTLKDSLFIHELGKQMHLRLKVGFNYRHYPAIEAAKDIISKGSLGNLLYGKFTLGHAARPNYDKEWRTDRVKAGGGALLDPGIHIIDLARYFFGDLKHIYSHLPHTFWNTYYEDNAFVNLISDSGKTVLLHSSVTEWKNVFTIELIGDLGYLKITGRGGFYGKQKLEWNKKWAWTGGDNQPFLQEFSEDDVSFRNELSEFFKAIEENRDPIGNSTDNLEAIRLITDIYSCQ